MSVAILVLCGRVNFRNLSHYCDYSECTNGRQFREPLSDWPAFHQRVLMTVLDPCCETGLGARRVLHPEEWLAPSVSGISSTAVRVVPSAIEISTLAVVDVTRRCAFTLAVSQTPPG